MHAKGPELATLFARIVGIVDGFPSRLGAGIRFADYVFAEPVPLDSFLVPPQMMAIYAVLVPDPTWGPRQFQPIFFGIINGQRQGQLSPEEYRSCLRVAGGKGLYVATCNLPPLFQPSESHRIQRELIHVYSPLCNRDAVDAPSADLAGKVDALEKKNQEHDSRWSWQRSVTWSSPLRNPRRDPLVSSRVLRQHATPPPEKDVLHNHLLQLIRHAHTGMERELSTHKGVTCNTRRKCRHYGQILRISVGVNRMRLVYPEVFIDRCRPAY